MHLLILIISVENNKTKKVYAKINSILGALIVRKITPPNSSSMSHCYYLVTYNEKNVCTMNTIALLHLIDIP